MAKSTTVDKPYMAAAVVKTPTLISISEFFTLFGCSVVITLNKEAAPITFRKKDKYVKTKTNPLSDTIDIKIVEMDGIKANTSTNRTCGTFIERAKKTIVSSIYTHLFY